MKRRRCIISMILTGFCMFLTSCGKADPGQETLIQDSALGEQQMPIQDSTSVGQEDGRQDAGIPGQGTSDEGLEEEESQSADTPKDQPSEPAEVILGVWRTTSRLKEYVGAFNRGDYGYKVTIRSYYGEGEGVSEETALLRMQAELASSTGPDIILLDYPLDAETMAAQDYLEDLSPYFADSKVVKEEDFLESVIDAYTYDGKLVAVPRQMVLQTLWGKTEIVGEESGWTVEDMLSLAGRYPDIPLASGMSRDEFLTYCLLFAQGEELLNLDAGADSCLGQILSQAASYPATASYEQLADRCWQMHQGEALLVDLSLETLDIFLMLPGLAGRDEIIPVGYPAWDGEPRAFLQAAEGPYAIPAGAANKEGAWVFLELLFSGTLDAPRIEKPFAQKWGLPTRTEELEVSVQEELDKLHEIKWETALFTQEQAMALLEELTAMASPYPSSDFALLEIIYEEAEVYFEGGKTLEETLQVIENRGRMYLQEGH